MCAVTKGQGRALPWRVHNDGVAFLRAPWMAACGFALAGSAPGVVAQHSRRHECSYAPSHYAVSTTRLHDVQNFWRHE
eukprot:scaffold134394_cov48-Prasinocladus_malaysianus.AAC.2